MYIYLPIAEMPVNIFVIFLLGGITGVLSGMFGIGGGFLMTPFLMLMGVSPAVAVSTSVNQMIGASFSGFIAHLHRSNVDIKIGTLIIFGGFTGSSLGVLLFAKLKSLGQIDFAISACYVIFLGVIGSFMAHESVRALTMKKKGIVKIAPDKKNWLLELPLPLVWEFPKSHIKVSVILPFSVGFFSGVLSSIMGIGGGFILVPAMIYILGMPTSVVVGTSLFNSVFVTANVTLLQAVSTHTVDAVLAMLILTSSVIGAQVGARVGLKVPAEHLRVMLAIMVLAVVIKLGLGLVITPSSLFDITMLDK